MPIVLYKLQLNWVVLRHEEVHSSGWKLVCFKTNVLFWRILQLLYGNASSILKIVERHNQFGIHCLCFVFKIVLVYCRVLSLSTVFFWSSPIYILLYFPTHEIKLPINNNSCCLSVLHHHGPSAQAISHLGRGKTHNRNWHPMWGPWYVDTQLRLIQH